MPARVERLIVDFNQRVSNSTYPAGREDRAALMKVFPAGIRSPPSMAEIYNTSGKRIWNALSQMMRKSWPTPCATSIHKTVGGGAFTCASRSRCAGAQPCCQDEFAKWMSSTGSQLETVQKEALHHIEETLRPRIPVGAVAQDLAGGDGPRDSMAEVFKRFRSPA